MLIRNKNKRKATINLDLLINLNRTCSAFCTLAYRSCSSAYSARPKSLHRSDERRGIYTMTGMRNRCCWRQTLCDLDATTGHRHILCIKIRTRNSFGFRSVGSHNLRKTATKSSLLISAMIAQPRGCTYRSSGNRHARWVDNEHGLGKAHKSDAGDAPQGSADDDARSEKLHDEVIQRDKAMESK